MLLSFVPKLHLVIFFVCFDLHTSFVGWLFKDNFYSIIVLEHSLASPLYLLPLHVFFFAVSFSIVYPLLPWLASGEERQFDPFTPTVPINRVSVYLCAVREPEVAPNSKTVPNSS